MEEIKSFPLNNVVAIDGPAGSGKSTVSKLVAKKLNFSYIDTGAMYRAITLKAMREGLDLEDKDLLVELANRTIVDISANDDGSLKVSLDGADVTDDIRTPQLTSKVAYIARAEGVRSQMVKAQREIGRKGNCVFEGRDIATVVFPTTKYKFYLDASQKERAYRRYKELIEKGIATTLEGVEADIQTRDSKDKNRKVGALKVADDAILIDTTGLTISEVVDKICELI